MQHQQYAVLAPILVLPASILQLLAFHAQMAISTCQICTNATVAVPLHTTSVHLTVSSATRTAINAVSFLPTALPAHLECTSLKATILA